jgi:ubiquinone/menaquinone biosynthesis C-methylase UbiE
MDGLKLDIGCGPNKAEGFVGLDVIAFPGVDHVCNVGADRWPFEDNSVSEARAIHFLEHLTNLEGKCERIHFFNELYRVLRPEAGCLLVFPHWASQRYYGDPTHREPFSEFGFLYLQRDWRLGSGAQPPQAPHTDITYNPHGYSCNFHCNYQYAYQDHLLKTRTPEFVAFAAQYYKEVVTDIYATVIAKK